MYCLIVAESAIFTIFVAAYIFYIGKSLSGPTPREILNVPDLQHDLSALEQSDDPLGDQPRCGKARSPVSASFGFLRSLSARFSSSRPDANGIT